MDWDYLKALLPLYGFPDKFISWVMGCVTSAEFSLVFNGRGDGFFRPQCGLRQGCALSPYLFILGMDLLSRGFSYLVETEQFTGVRIAPTAAPITNCLYADDLLLFGAATNHEARVLMQCIEAFTAVSGQQIGPAKSDIWFSHATEMQVRESISDLLMVPQLNQRDIWVRLFWKEVMHMISLLMFFPHGCKHGRVVLIKSVLLSIPVYHMSTTMLPTRVVKALTSIVRRFFWGKSDKTRYLAYVAWDKVTRPIKEGGLGIRNLGTVNEALLMKMVWRVANEHNSQWVDVVRAKNFPRTLMWQSARTYVCTVFWRSIMKLRPKLLPLVSCNIVALQFRPNSISQVRLQIRDLVNDENGCWDAQMLVNLFGHTACMQILTTVKPPTLQLAQGAPTRDALIFNLATNGDYSVKKAYHHLRGLGASISQEASRLWQDIWKKGNILPRVRLFMWKLMHNALPLGGILASRGIRLDAQCALCGCEDENVRHMLFECPFARLCWFASPLAVRSHVFEGTLAERFRQISRDTNDQQWTGVANVMWALWRCRNDMTYSSKKPTLQRFMGFLTAISNETTISLSVSYVEEPQPMAAPEQQAQVICNIYGSWLSQWEGGVGYIIMKGTELLGYFPSKVQVCSPLQGEASDSKWP